MSKPLGLVRLEGLGKLKKFTSSSIENEYRREKNILGSRVRLAHKVENFTAIYEPIV
jgi:hypothetical protein